MKSTVRFFCIAIFSSLSLAWAKESDWKLFLLPEFGMKHGTVGEYVFAKTSNYSDDMISELIYDTKPELYGGLKIGGGWRNIAAEVSVSAGFPMKTGTLADSDWLNNSTSEVSKASSLLTSNYKTNYSESECNLDYDFSCAIKLGYAFPVFKNSILSINIKPFYSFGFNNFKFTAKNGEAWYGAKLADGDYAAWNDEANRASNSGKFSSTVSDYDGEDLSYRRWSVIHWIGFDATVGLPLKFTVNAGFQVAPYVYAESTDLHYLNNSYGGTAYLDVADGFFSTFKWNCGVSYQISRRNTVSVLPQDPARGQLQKIIQPVQKRRREILLKRKNIFNRIRHKSVLL